MARCTITKVSNSVRYIYFLNLNRWAPPEDFYDLVADPIHDIIVLQQVDDESNSIFDARKIASRTRRLPGIRTMLKQPS